MRLIIAAVTLVLASGLVFAQSAPSSPSKAADLLNNAPPISTTIDGVVFSAQPNSDVRLQPLPGSFSTTNAFITVLMFLNYPDRHATARTSGKRPVLYLKIGVNPKGRAYLVRVESNPKTNNRHLKIGRSGFASISDLSSPDAQWIVECTVSEESPGIWKMVPNSDLAPGEYGLFVPTVAGSLGVPPNGNLYDFGVD